MTLINCTLISQELREHILHMRREMTRLHQSPLPVRQRLSQRVTELLNLSPVVVAETGFRRREKDAEPNEQSTIVHHRAPNEWELREFIIQPLVAIGMPGQHQQDAGEAKQQNNPEGAQDLDQLRDALALANARVVELTRERDQAQAELASLKVPGAQPAEVVATLEIGDYQDDNSVYVTLTKKIGINDACEDDRLMRVSQHERILADQFARLQPVATIAVLGREREPDEGPYLSGYAWSHLRKLPDGTKLFTAPPVTQLQLGLLESGNPLSNAAYSLAQKPGHTLTEYDCALLTELRKKWDAAVVACGPALEN
ncbi:hypothetical protein ACSVIJ_04955 [Pseudomonas sp. NCHU5208]|uniref:hypothetical protein n=1 Tax=unclassified Pseudomonas TaxID=196821 RepID=UPI003F9B3196